MRMLKLLSVCLLAVCLLATLCACGGEPSNPVDGSTTTTTSNTTTMTTAAQATSYTVIVKDADGNPISGAMVQLCKETCIPTMTNANGVANWSMEVDEYKVSFAIVPTGYAVEEAYYFEDGATEMTITLQAAE